MEYKDLTALAGRHLTPLEAYRLASPAQRRLWFGDEPPELESKAAPAGVSHLTPELEAKLANHQHDHQPAGPCRHARYTAELWDCKCARCKGTPAQRAEDRRWQRHAAATRLAQELAAGQLGTGSVPVVPLDQAVQRDSIRNSFHAMVEDLLA